MLHLYVVLLHVVLLTGGPVQTAAEQPQPQANLQLESVLDPISNAQLIDAIIAAAPVEPGDDLEEPEIEPAAPGSDESGWMEEGASGVAYPLTETMSIGLDYQIEEIEDLTAAHIEMGTAGVDYTSHKVLVRAQWQFDLIP